MIHRWLQKTVNGDVLGSHKFGLAAAVIVLSLIDDVKLIELKGLNFSTVELELEKNTELVQCWKALEVVQAAKIRHFLIKIIIF